MSSQTQDTSSIINCLEATFGKGFPLDEELAKLENELLEQKLLLDTSLTQYRLLLFKIRKETETTFDKLNTDAFKYVSETGFLGCSKPQEILALPPEQIKRFVLMATYAFGSRHHATIDVVLPDNEEITVNGHSVNKQDFLSAIKEERKKLLDKGIIIQDVWVRLSVAENIKMVRVIDIQEDLKAGNFRKIQYKNL